MAQRYMYIWFRHITTDWLTRRRPNLKDTAVVFATLDHNRKVVTVSNSKALSLGILPGMVIADALVQAPDLEVIDEQPELADKLLHQFALWGIRFTPIVAVDPPDGIVLDISGCTHLWGGERAYFKEVILKLKSYGYNVRGAIADTIGAAWAWSRFGSKTPILEPGRHEQTLLPLSPAALRLDTDILMKLKKLGIRSIGNIVQQPRLSLLPRFGKELTLRLDQAFGTVGEVITPVRPLEPYKEWLPCLEPIRTAIGIEIALTRLLKMLCHRLQQEGKGLRTAVFSGHRVDGKVEQVMIGTTRATHNINHLFKLFSEKLPSIEPDLGIEVFVLEAPKVEEAAPDQESLWGGACTIDSISMAELLDRLSNKAGADAIHRYLPAEHHRPERSYQPASSMQEKPATARPYERSRPIHLLRRPELVEVSAPIPDYPPMNFKYNGKLHTIQKADGPERIEDEWWIEPARSRDYYTVEDQDGARYWLFRSGHYTDGGSVKWFLHGFFP